MPAVYERRHTIAADEIDGLGHANNVVYLEWMQAAAVDHSAALGWPGKRYRELGQGWVVRSHAIEYLRPAFLGETILVRTWVAQMRKATSLRRYEIVRLGDGVVLAKAETRWAFVDYATGQPARIPAEIRIAFSAADS